MVVSQTEPQNFPCRVKQEDNEYKKKLKTTGGGSPPNPPEPSEEMALAASMMSEELAMGSDVCDTMDMQFGDAIRIGK